MSSLLKSTIVKPSSVIYFPKLTSSKLFFINSFKRTRYTVSSHRLFQILLLILFPVHQDGIGEGLYLLNKTVLCAAMLQKNKQIEKSSREKLMCLFFVLSEISWYLSEIYPNCCPNILVRKFYVRNLSDRNFFVLNVHHNLHLLVTWHVPTKQHDSK